MIAEAGREPIGLEPGLPLSGREPPTRATSMPNHSRLITAVSRAPSASFVGNAMFHALYGGDPEVRRLHRYGWYRCGFAATTGPTVWAHGTAGYRREPLERALHDWTPPTVSGRTARPAGPGTGPRRDGRLGPVARGPTSRAGHPGDAPWRRTRRRRRGARSRRPAVRPSAPAGCRGARGAVRSVAG